MRGAIHLFMTWLSILALCLYQTSRSHWTRDCTTIVLHATTVFALSIYRLLFSHMILPACTRKVKTGFLPQEKIERVC
jgi:hypothetical protein